MLRKQMSSGTDVEPDTLEEKPLWENDCRVITGNHSPGSVDDSTGERKASYRIIRLFVVITLVHWMCPPCVSGFPVSRSTFPCRSRGG